ncbi:MAG: nickel pincer cofactor biosynthesis protein LarC [Verrucomicrobia bacterium]|nr:nickel pincer cofactor biosynthesis protein LarC [Verrucomicrobiota bacterium]
MNGLYLDLSSGVSGDMFVGALLDLGVDFEALAETLRRVPVGGYRIETRRERRGGVAGTRFCVELEGDRGMGSKSGHSLSGESREGAHGAHFHHHDREGRRNFRRIRELLQDSELSEWVKAKAAAVFERLARAEAKVHGVSPEEVHFHEVGATDSIVDIVGGCAALELLGRPRVLASEATDGSGWVDCAHGRLPVPAPATIEVAAARGMPIHQCEEPHELITPTGAALVAEFAEAFGPMPRMRPRRVGYGLGARTNRTRPNALRAVLGELEAQPETGELDGAQTDWVTALEATVDDMTPECLGEAVSRLLQAGALDVFLTPAQMKKQRPGATLTVLCAPEEAPRLARRIFEETSTFGVRAGERRRWKLRREMRSVQTPYGPVEVKLGWLGKRLMRVSPEFESCRRCAEAARISVQDVYAAAVAASARFMEPAAGAD